MKELVGYCKLCSKTLFCNDGFFEGIVLENKTVVCFECHHDEDLPSSDQTDTHQTPTKASAVS